MARRIDRRDFLTRTALGAAALTLPARSFGQAPAGAPAPKDPAGMFVSLPPWAVARNVGWPEQARLAARVGYQGIDWAFGSAKTAGLDATVKVYLRLLS